MARIDSLRTRIESLEKAEGFVVLDDGTKFKPDCSGIRIYCECLRHERADGRKPVLSDFTEAEQEQIRGYAKWTPDPHLHGQLSVITCQLCREIVARSLSFS